MTGTSLLQKNRIGRRVLICELRREGLCSQISGTQNLNARARNEGEVENEFFHVARRINGPLADCLSGQIPEFLAWPPSDFALQNCCNLGGTP